VGEGAVGGLLRIEDPTAPEGVVRHHETAVAEEAEGLLVVVEVALLVGVDEDHVEVAGRQAPQRVERTTAPELDLLAERGPREEGGCDVGVCVGELAGDELAVLRKRRGDAQSRKTGEGADLHHPARTHEPNEEPQEGTFDRPNHHVRCGGALAGDGGQLVEDGVERAGMRRRVGLDVGVDDLAHPASLASVRASSSYRWMAERIDLSKSARERLSFSPWAFV